MHLQGKHMVIVCVLFLWESFWFWDVNFYWKIFGFEMIYKSIRCRFINISQESEMGLVVTWFKVKPSQRKTQWKKEPPWNWNNLVKCEMVHAYIKKKHNLMFANNNKCLQYLVKQNETFIYRIFGFRLFFRTEPHLFPNNTVVNSHQKNVKIQCLYDF